MRRLFVKICYNRAWSSLYTLLCPASGMNTKSVECLISQAEYVYFKHGTNEFVRPLKFTMASDAKTVVAGSSPGTDRHLSLMHTPFIW